MHADPVRGVGVFTALRDISEGGLLSHPYLTVNLALLSTPLRRRILYCQRGMFCACSSCNGFDWLRQLPSLCGGGDTLLHDGASQQWQCSCARCTVPVDIATILPLLDKEEELAGAALKLYASVDVEQPRGLPVEQLKQLRSLLSRCTDVLGSQHWSTQALRRLELMQDYESTGRAARREEWVQRMDECQVWVNAMLQRCEAEGDERCAMKHNAL